MRKVTSVLTFCRIMGSMPTRGNETFSIFIFLVLVGTKHGVEFRHSARNASRIRRTVSNVWLNEKGMY